MNLFCWGSPFQDWPLVEAARSPSADSLQQQLQELSLQYADKSQQHSALSVQLVEAEQREAVLRETVEGLRDQLERLQVGDLKKWGTGMCRWWVVVGCCRMKRFLVEIYGTGAPLGGVW